MPMLTVKKGNGKHSSANGTYLLCMLRAIRLSLYWILLQNTLFLHCLQSVWYVFVYSIDVYVGAHVCGEHVDVSVCGVHVSVHMCVYTRCVV